MKSELRTPRCFRFVWFGMQVMAASCRYCYICYGKEMTFFNLGPGGRVISRTTGRWQLSGPADHQQGGGDRPATAASAGAKRPGLSRRTYPTADTDPAADGDGQGQAVVRQATACPGQGGLVLGAGGVQTEDSHMFRASPCRGAAWLDPRSPG